MGAPSTPSLGASAPPGASAPRVKSAIVPPVRLGESEECAVMAGTSIIGTNITSVTGDLAVSPGSSVVGFPPGSVSGSIEVDNAEARREMAAAAAAYNDAAGRTPTATLPAQLGGTTLPPGVYDTPGGEFELSGTLTLDAEGDPEATFIFQATSLDTARVSNIDFNNGAQADNVIWQVDTDATLGNYSTFRGNVLALNSVDVSTGTAMYGRAMAINGTVSVDGTPVLPATRVDASMDPPTETTLTSSPNPSRRGEPVDFIATVTGNEDGVSPTNKVLFKDGPTVIGSAMLDRSGHAVFTTSELTRGAHEITAVYVNGGTAVGEGWVHFAPSKSPVLVQQVLNRRETRFSAWLPPFVATPFNATK
ncbi:ice-binding family protein [Streptosporangium sp. CA-135522]|uniref:ice-binding family protein n=1 Tax=Streptosporangium sp. CA-135522 TaxID=3240072 RepID=UPI003D94E928